MNLADIIQHAGDYPLTAELVRSACEEEKTTVQGLFDAFAATIADRYLAGSISWQHGDGAMNSLFSYAYVFSDECLSDYARSVFEAFDQAEYVHPGDSPGLDYERRTKEMLLRTEKTAEPGATDNPDDAQ